MDYDGLDTPRLWEFIVAIGLMLCGAVVAMAGVAGVIVLGCVMMGVGE